MNFLGIKIILNFFINLKIANSHIAILLIFQKIFKISIGLEGNIY